MPPPIRLNERCAYAQKGTEKRAALLFDRIAGKFEPGDIPSELVFEVPGAEVHEETVRKELTRRLRERLDKTRNYSAEEVINLVEEYWGRHYVESAQRCGYRVTPVYLQQTQYFAENLVGQSVVYQAALQNIPDLVEDNVSWEQIAEFRKDKESLRKLRNMRMWIECFVKAESVIEAEDIISRKVDDYEWALRKHGLKTATGSLSSIFDWKGVTAITSGVGLTGFLGGPIWSALAGGLILGGRISLWIAERMIDREDVARGEGSEIAFICDAKRRLDRRA